MVGSLQQRSLQMITAIEFTDLKQEFTVGEGGVQNIVVLEDNSAGVYYEARVLWFSPGHKWIAASNDTTIIEPGTDPMEIKI